MAKKRGMYLKLDEERLAYLEGVAKSVGAVAITGKTAGKPSIHNLICDKIANGEVLVLNAPAPQNSDFRTGWRLSSSDSTNCQYCGKNGKFDGVKVGNIKTTIGRKTKSTAICQNCIIELAQQLSIVLENNQD